MTNFVFCAIMKMCYIRFFRKYLGAVAFAEQPRHFFTLANPPSDKKDDLVMVVHIHSVVLTGFLAESHDQVHGSKFVHGLDHKLALHSGLLRNVVVAVPANIQLCAKAFA